MQNPLSERKFGEGISLSICSVLRVHFQKIGDDKTGGAIG